MHRRTLFAVLSSVPIAFAACAAGADEPSQAHSADPPGFEVTKTDAEWRKLLTKDQYQVLREHDHRAARFQSARWRTSSWDLSLRGLRPAALRVAGEVRQ